MNIERKKQKEKDIIAFMIHLYCKHHQDINEKQLIQYTFERIEKCPRIETKTFCSQCPIHCYQKNKQEEIKKVMRYSGVRMIFYHPILVLRHALKR